MDAHPWLQHYDKGVPQTINYPPVPIFHFLEESARKYPEQRLHHLQRCQNFLPGNECYY